MAACSSSTTTRCALAGISRRQSGFPSKKLSLKAGQCSRLFSISPQGDASVEVLSCRQEALTLLHKTTAVLPRALSRGAHPGISLEFWDDILSKCSVDLNSTTERSARIVVYGVDEWAGARELVTALLAEPLSSNSLHAETLRDRWNHVSQRELTISNLQSGSSSSHVQISSTYLSQFPIPVEITEVLPSSSQTLDQNTAAALFDADIPILVCNPLSTSLSTLLTDTRLPTNTILVLISSSSELTLSALNAALRSTPLSSSTPAPKNLRILLVDPPRAIHAIQTLTEDPKSAAAIQRYQDGFVESGISKITESLRSEFLNLDAIQNKNYATSPSTALRTKTAISHVWDALSACGASISQNKEEFNRVSADVSELTKHIEETYAVAQKEVFGIKHGSSKNVTGDEVTNALKSAEKDMKAVMDRLTWWRMFPHVDEISSIVASAVERAWCLDLEKKLILHTGRLSVLQKRFTHASFSLLEKHPKAPFNSAILHNKLLQLQTSPTYRLKPKTLTVPLHERRNQISFPTTRLHLAAQRTVFGTSGGVVVGVGVSWAGWLGWLAGSGEGLLGFIGLDPGTAIGVGVLSIVASVRWAAGRWEKSKKRWWQDWTRVSEGLDRDLRETLNTTIREKIAVVADYTCTQVTEIVKTKRDETHNIEGELNTLKTEVTRVMGRTHPRP